MWPKVQRLHVHLPEEHNVIFDGDANFEDLEEQVADETEQVSTLLAYFQLNREDEDARQLLYQEIPQHYTFQKDKWKRRKTVAAATGRLMFVSPAGGERYYLHELLVARRGYEALRRVDGVVHPNFHAACVALNLIENDYMWIKTMDDAATFKLALQMRSTFVLLIVHNAVANPLDLYKRYQGEMSYDFLRDYNRRVYGYEFDNDREHLPDVGSGTQTTSSTSGALASAWQTSYPIRAS